MHMAWMYSEIQNQHSLFYSDSIPKAPIDGGRASGQQTRLRNPEMSVFATHSIRARRGIAGGALAADC